MPRATVPDNTENFEEAFYTILADGHDPASSYDYLVLFSGGKDSMYMVHKLKEARGARICLFTVDNWFEEDGFLDHARENAGKLGCDLYVFQPPAERFIRFYRFLITEPALRKIDTNPLCFFCARYFMALGVSFAEKMGIPFVLYGATPEQINRGEKPGTLRELSIFEMVSKRSFMGYYATIQALPAYQNDPVIKDVVDAVFHHTRAVRLMFPYQYLPYHVDAIKQTLCDAYGWRNPAAGVNNDEYLTSGCKLVRLFGVLARKAGFIPHEQEQFRKDYASGIVGHAAYRYNQDLLESIMNAEATPEVVDLAEKLGLKEQLIDGGTRQDG